MYSLPKNINKKIQKENENIVKGFHYFIIVIVTSTKGKTKQQNKKKL